MCLFILHHKPLPFTLRVCRRLAVWSLISSPKHGRLSFCHFVRLLGLRCRVIVEQVSRCCSGLGGCLLGGIIIVIIIVSTKKYPSLCFLLYRTWLSCFTKRSSFGESWLSCPCILLIVLTKYGSRLWSLS